MFPLRAREGGVLVRAGQTEAAVDLARLAGLTPAGVICEIMNDDGTMARVPQLEEFCARHGLKMISVADLIRYRLKHEKFVRRVAEGCIETEFGEFRTVAYASDLNPEYHLALVRGDVAGKESVLVRMHSRCMYGDVFGSTACDCAPVGARIRCARIAEEGTGVLVYLHETGPGFRSNATVRERRVWSRTAGISCTTKARPASGNCSTSTASARRSCPTWGCTPSGC